MTAVQEITIRPQPGPQVMFLSSSADIAIFGGAAGGGKSYALMVEPLRHVLSVPGFAAVLFRRNMTSIKLPGALWDESLKLYGPMRGMEPTAHIQEWNAKGGGKIKMAHLEYDSTVFDWHGAQVALICFDELTSFSQFQFFYMLSRNRSTCGVKPYIRATCNPDADSWVAEFIEWWIDQETGFAIPERAGVLRWFVRVGDKLVWANDPAELTAELIGAPSHTPEGDPIDYMPKSVTFVPATIFDNKELLKVNPEYLSNLMAQTTVERERLLRGNWKVRAAAGTFFQRLWCQVIEPHEVPPGLRFKRGWDLAGTPKTPINDPDFTCSTKLGRTDDGTYYVVDHTWMQDTPGKVEIAVRNAATHDGRDTEIWLPQDPGQAGKAQVLNYQEQFDGYSLRYSPEKGDKETRFGPFSARAQAGRVKVVRGAWNERWFSQLEGFPDLKHDDDVDSTSRAYNAFLDSTTGLIDYYKGLAQAERRKVEDRVKDLEKPALVNGGVKVKAPDGKGINVLYDMRGQPLFCDADGVFIVDPKQLIGLKRAGFTLV